MMHTFYSGMVLLGSIITVNGLAVYANHLHRKDTKRLKKMRDDIAKEVNDLVKLHSEISECIIESSAILEDNAMRIKNNAEKILEENNEK